MRKQCIGIASFISVFCLAASAAQANNPSCDGKAGLYSTSCADPGPHEVVVYGDANGSGKCMRFSSTFVDPVNSPGAPPGWIPILDNYGFNDCISSVKVGSNVRLLAFQDVNYNNYGPVPLNLDWTMATYEPDFSSPWYAEPTVNDDFSSLIVQDISQTNGEPIPNRYILSDPTSDANAFWEEEPQGLCHNKTDWFITQEVDISGPINPDFTCVQDQELMGRVWKVPRDFPLNLSPPYPPVYLDQKDLPAAFSTWSGYRHFGDPDCQTISGRDYVFIPVQTCKANSGTLPLPIVLVLDSDLNFVTAWTIPPQPSNYNDVMPLATCLGVPLDANAYSNVMGGHGMAAWVAVRPSSSMIASNVEVWMGTDVCSGLGLQIFTGDLTVPGDSVPMSYRSPGPVITDFAGTPEGFQALQGAVFSPSGRTLYMTNGDTSHQGGIRVILPDTGQEISESGDNYGPFNFQDDDYDWLGIPTGEEPEGLDFLDTRCPGTPVADFGADPADQQSAQLHVTMNHNGLHLFDNSGDQVELRHYSVNASESNPMCEPMLFDGTSEPAISSQGGGTLDVFAVAGGRVFQRSYNNPGWDPTWTPLPSLESPRLLVGKPASVSWGPGRIDLFAHDDLGNIRHLWANSGSWAPTWETIAGPIGGACSGYGCMGLTAASWGVNRLDVFDTVPGDLIQVTYDNGWNPPWYPLGDASPPANGAISAVSWGPSRIDLVVTPWFTDNAWQIGQYYSNDGVTFYGPYPLGPSGVYPLNVALSSWGYSDLEVVTVGTSSTSMIVGQRGFRPGLAWVDWTTSALSPDPGSLWPWSVSSTSSGDGRIDIVYGRKDPTLSTTTVWHAWYNNTDPVGWFGPEPL